MTGVALASVWNLGGQICGSVLGLPFAQYRPTSVTAPIGTPLSTTLPCWITPDADGMAKKAADYKKPIWYLLADPTQTQVGDYLIGAIVYGGPSMTFFIASQDVPDPVQIVRCNRVLSFSRPGDPATGSGYYGGDAAGAETVLATGWPASVLNTGRRDPGELKLPGDTTLPQSEILIPGLLGTLLKTGDRIVDDLGTSYTITAREQTSLGWRLLVVAAFA